MAQITRKYKLTTSSWRISFNCKVSELLFQQILKFAKVRSLTLLPIHNISSSNDKETVDNSERERRYNNVSVEVNGLVQETWGDFPNTRGRYLRGSRQITWKFLAGKTDNQGCYHSLKEYIHLQRLIIWKMYEIKWIFICLLKVLIIMDCC